ncbi:hypothetical protein PNEG_02123 [Pneumocystis murina B123]|uniref:Uncharacterized protein n=1 Tax=Pneumocystis murina (strain B123) TaxID=1069680 RepID=M7NQJ0_PNEMU|nr:hypothetical protein PNEG_02123 [Pneumocystis murina B123]EMR09537.1 hypothetical protein PNEG_02123 [Pneumocystis murina B123]
MAFSDIFYLVFNSFQKVFFHIKHSLGYIHEASSYPLRSLFEVYPNLTSISLLLLTLYVSLYVLGRTFRGFKAFLRIFFLVTIISCIIYTWKNGIDAAQAKVENAKKRIRELVFLLINKKHSGRR